MIRTDLALEAKEFYHENAKDVTEIEGVKAKVKKVDKITVTEVEVLSEKGEKAIGKKRGKYITIEAPEFRSYPGFYFEPLTFLLKNEISDIVRDKYKNVLIAGLGNRKITADSIGPKTIDNIIVTRHLFQNSIKGVENFSKVSAVIPGVLGTTGIESAEMIKSICEKIKPDLVVLIDSLASRKTNRVATTIQLSTTGISPGSGIGNLRKEIDKAYLGTDVISIGVPMVINTKTVAFDLLNSFNVDKEIIEKELKDDDMFVVSPKDTDVLSLEMSKIISYAINLTFHSINIDEIEGYIN